MTHADPNLSLAGVLDDMAALQTSVYPRRAYERAARAVLLLDEPVTAASVRELASSAAIGNSALTLIREQVTSGASPTFEAALARSGRREEVAQRRRLRDGFLSLSVARQVLDQPLDAVGREHYRGDFQMHTTWSDGARSVPEMALACVERGYEYLAITDHSAGLSIARGLSRDSLRAQQTEIDAINATFGKQLRVFKGIEANIPADGGIDVSAADLASVDMVLAAPHSKLDSREDQTRRLLGAVATPGVHILAHPSGRKFGRRAGLRVHWEQVFAAAVQHDVAIEIDGDPSRQDVSFALVCQALEAGCVFAIDSDAHDTDQLVYTEIALAHARLAGVPPDRVLNCWPRKTLETWLKQKSS